MSAGAKEQVARLLTLVPFLHARGEVRVEEAAAALGVQPDQLVQDLQVLFMCGTPGGYPDDLIDVDLEALDEDGDRVIRVSNADYLSRPMRLTATEASAVIVALRALRNGARDATREVVDRALAKLETAAAEGSGAQRIDPGAGAGDPDLALLATRLQAAADQRRQVRLSYYVPARDERSERIVDPRGVVTAKGFSYLDAWCHSAEAPRLFRLDRVESAEVLDAAILSEPEAPRDLGDGFFTSAQDTTPVTLELQPQARWMVDYYPVEDVRPREDGVLHVDLAVADPRWLVRLLLRLAPYATVVEPVEHEQARSEAARAALALYA
ncbi:YafY family protein [Nocardioides sp. SYSU D00038]|uniref:helix-turn-helix transcriptional regulator n=1 Tax=Nocardioides sp. SYSU D00038 TaxID=2812554 RepID=UPI0019673C94|nr:WYL domain-containing protein [Nocardioides sp. SYSU D00038]